MELQSHASDDFRSLDVSIPFPALPYLPKLSYHRHAYEPKPLSAMAGKVAARGSVKAHLPFGLTFEAGRRLDRFGRQDDEFVGLNIQFFAFAETIMKIGIMAASVLIKEKAHRIFLKICEQKAERWRFGSGQLLPAFAVALK